MQCDAHCNAHLGSRSLFDHTTAISPKHVEPSIFVCAYNDGVPPATLNPLAEAQALISSRCTLSYLVPLLCHHIPPQRAETRSRLLLSLRIGSGGLENYVAVVGLVASFVRSAERTTVGFGA
ncbi:hypothetical protein BU23DRAFT_548314 [Bimuria novae-zelandiae CBS 107.79]|uniref:Uncharacterized protein n=1 Tax=Bimuria novae-zelandiae CBS 107.79 TaxID=1447943 RepID=A0A6A5VU57_9PLEO|nr:hypothetical protein BU23DRAFT_548314 [Bimuria novae-zelandiae CBS 107.79]